MAVAKKIKDRILADAQQEAEVISQNANEKSEQEVANILSASETECKKILKNAEIDAIERKRRALAVADLESRKIMLTARQALIAQVMAEVVCSLQNLGDEAYFACLEKNMALCALPGKQDVILNAKDLARCTPARFLKLQTAAQKEQPTAVLTLSQNSADIDGGFMLKAQGMDVDASLSAVVESRKSEFEVLAAQMLFAK